MPHPTKSHPSAHVPFSKDSGMLGGVAIIGITLIATGIIISAFVDLSPKVGMRGDAGLPFITDLNRQ